MLLLTLAFIIIELAVAITAPKRFVLLSLWVQTIPYTWNWDTQLVFDTPLGPLNVIAMQLFGFCLACLAIIASNTAKASAQTRLYRWHLAFIALCTFSLIYAPSAVFGFRMIAKLLSPLLFLVVVLTTLDSLDELAKLRRAIIGSGVILIGLALYARATGIVSDPNASQTGIAGLGPPSMGPPVFAAHMLPVAMLALASFLSRRNVLMLVFTIACAASVLAALQRTSAAALYLGFSVILLFGTRGIWRLLMPSLGVVGLPALVIFNDTFRRRMFFGDSGSQELLDDPTKALSKINTSGRSGLWNNMLDRFFEPHPVLGSGIGSTQDFLYSRTTGAAGVAHSEYVRLLCEVGLCGLTAFLAMAIAYFWMLRKLAAPPYGDAQRALAIAAIGSLVSYLVYCSTDNSFDYAGQFGIYVFGLIAASLRANQVQVEDATYDATPALAPVSFPNLLR